MRILGRILASLVTGVITFGFLAMLLGMVFFAIGWFRPEVSPNSFGEYIGLYSVVFGPVVCAIVAAILMWRRIGRKPQRPWKR